MKTVKCGCEFNAQTLVSLCPAHAEYFTNRSRLSEAPAPLSVVPDHKRKLRNELLAAGLPALITKARSGSSVQDGADGLVRMVHAIVERVD
jgi:hypothetical protein